MTGFSINIIVLQSARAWWKSDSDFLTPLLVGISMSDSMFALENIFGNCGKHEAYRKSG